MLLIFFRYCIFFGSYVCVCVRCTYYVRKSHTWACVCICVCLYASVFRLISGCVHKMFPKLSSLSLIFGGHVCMPCIFAFGVAAGKNHATLFFSFIFAWSITLVRFIFLSPASISWSALSCLKLLSEYLFDTIVCVCVFFFSSWEISRQKAMSLKGSESFFVALTDLTYLFCSVQIITWCRLHFAAVFMWCWRPIHTHSLFFLPLFRLFQHLMAFM